MLIGSLILPRFCRPGVSIYSVVSSLGAETKRNQDMLADTMPAQKQPASAFGARLIALRKAAGLTQVQLAAAVDISQSTLSYQEAEAGPPSGELLLRLATALRVPMAFT